MSKFSDVKFIKIGFLIGGIYDLLLGIGVLFFSDLMVDLFGITKPDNMIFVYISGLFLILVGYILIYAAYRNVEDFFFIGLGSCIIRFFYFAIVVIIWLTDDIELMYVLVGCTDALTGLFILIPTLLVDKNAWKQLWIKR
ncbi:MAG: hypothetical protein ACTSRJ_06180 [Candidatus Hodarchaeales archaeon]